MSELQDIANEKINAPPSDTPKRRGRPPGSKNRPRIPAPPDEGEKQPFVYIRDENQVKATALMVKTAWYLAAKMLPVRELTDEEAMELGEAADPVLCKWIPILGEWKYEANLLVCIITMYMATKIEKLKVPIPIEGEDVTGSRKK